MRIISPSILSADFLNLSREIDMLNRSHAEWIHVDVMDGVFVPNISFGFPVLKALKSEAKKVLDVHLMICHPECYIERFARAGADIIVFHIEATDNAKALIEQIKGFGCKAGVCIKPATPVVAIKELLPLLDTVLVMGVEPGFGGQSLMDSTFDKVRELNDYISEIAQDVVIEVDGGVTITNARMLCDAGATALVAGTAVFKSTNPEEAIDKLLNI